MVRGGVRGRTIDGATGNGPSAQAGGVGVSGVGGGV